ncbi:MAG: exo-alpha-sialidase [Bacillales bacterium]|nr:exo-alpha-sialidase [Bacillales bacterium]
MEMKKRVLTILLSALLVANISACNYESTHDDLETEETTNEIMDTTGSSDANSKDIPTNSENIPQNEQTTKDNKNNEVIKDLSVNELREKLGCYVSTTSSQNLKKLMSNDENKLKVEHEGYLSNVFYITTSQNGTEYKTTISLSKGIRVPDIYSGFTSDQNGYIIIFHMEEHSISPMDDIELVCVLKTSDGGKTWSTTEYKDFIITNNRQIITAACFFTEQIGFFTARYYNTDNFGGRTYWTVDGGKTWNRMPMISIPDVLEPYGLKGKDFATEVSDVELIDGGYLLTVRICHGYSCTVDGEYGMYIQYYSTDLENWTLVT